MVARAERCIRKTPPVDAWRATGVSSQGGKGTQTPCAMLGREVEVEAGWFRRANQRDAPSAVPCSRSRPLFPMRHACRIALGISTIIPEMHEGCLLGM